jgi:hypothetical protein
MACSINPQTVVDTLEKTFGGSNFTGAINVKSTSNAANVDDAAYNRYKTAFAGADTEIAKLENYVKGNCATTASSTLTSIGELQTEIADLKKKSVEKQEDVETAESRHNSIVKSEKIVSDYQGISARLGIMRPIHETSVSLLIGLGIFLTLASVYFGYSMLSPTSVMNIGAAGAAGASATGFIANFDKKAFLMGVGFVALLVGILSYLGVYGRSQM